jgi:hypothetical protein
MSDLILAVPDAIRLGTEAMFFDIGAFRHAGATAGMRGDILLMLFLAGMSRALGNAAILALNQVPGRRYGVLLAIEGAVFASGALVSATCAGLAAWLLSDESAPAANLFWVIALAHAPHILGVLILMPYAGEFIDRLLRLWSMALLLFGLHLGLGLSVSVSTASALLGWLTVRVLSLLLGGPLDRGVDWMLGLAAGRPLHVAAPRRPRRRSGRGGR